MSDIHDPRNPHEEVPEEQQRLLKDLRAMPRVSAPLDFSTHLARRIEEETSAATLPWWRRLFLSRTDGGVHIPAYAYGAAAASVLLIVSVYVFQTTDVERELRQEREKHQQVLPHEQQLDEQQLDERQFDEEQAENNTDPGILSAPSHTDRDEGTPARVNAAEKEDVIDPADDMRQRQPEPQAPASRTVAEPSKQKTLESDIRLQDEQRSAPSLRRAGYPPANKSESTSQEHEEYAPTMRGLLDTQTSMGLLPVDSSALKDSLRRLDSLRLGKQPTRPEQQRKPTPQNDPR